MVDRRETHPTGSGSEGGPSKEDLGVAEALPKAGRPTYLLPGPVESLDNDRVGLSLVGHPWGAGPEGECPLVGGSPQGPLRVSGQLKPGPHLPHTRRPHPIL